MKNNFAHICFALLLLCVVELKAQINYSFTAVSGTFTSITGSTNLIGSSVDDALSAAANIGFTFQYGCVNYTQFKVSSNGVLFLGSGATGTNNSNNLNTSTDRPAIAPLWDDLKTDGTGGVNYVVTGTSPNRVLTVEWKQMLWYYAATTWAISFQAKLYETTNVIEFVYSRNGTATGNISSASASIGISGTTSGDFYSLNGVGTSPTAVYGTETTTLSSKPASGQIYRFTPVQCSGTPTAGTAAATVTSGCGGLTTVLSLTGSTSGCGITYQWQSSPNNSTWTNIAGATSSTYTATVSSTTYYHCVVTCTNGGASASSSSVLITITANCYTMDNTSVTITSCPFSGVFYDSGGNGSNYSNSETYTKTFTAPAGSCLSFTFTTFQTENCCDHLYIYDGPNTSSTLLGTYQGTTSPGVVSASGTSITFQWTSDGSVVDIGWVANIGCATSCSGAPTAGSTVTNTTSLACGTNTVSLSLSGNTTGCGITYQWQSSPNNSTWTNIAGATSSTYTPAVTANTYYRCVVSCGGSSSNSSSVQITTPAGAPANDECTGATALIPGASCSGTVGNVTCASQSQAGCLGTANDDVWYSFVASYATQYINVTASASFDPVVQVFSGSCSSLTSIWCNDGSYLTGSSGSVAVTGLTVGATYYVRVYDYYSGYPTTTTFTICVVNPPSCPSGLGTGVVNVASLPYSSTGNTTCGKVDDITSTNAGAICGSSSYYGGEDMVYAFTPTVTGVVTIVQSNTSGTVGFMLYSGCPFSGTCVAYAQNSDASRTVCLTLTAGTTYYLVVDSWPSPSCYSYDISISAPVPGTPAGTDCSTANAIAALPYQQTGLTTCCKGNDYTSSNACASVYMGGEDYVFSYTPTSNTSIDITLSNTLSYTGVFVTQGCPNAGTCVASNTNSSGNPSLCGVSLTAGVTYYIIVDTDPSPSCTPFDILIAQSGALTTCNLAYTASSITYDNSDPLTAGTTITFTDDHFSNSYIPIGFTFCFDGIQYTQMIVSSNGYLIFDPINCVTNLPTGNATPGGYSAWSISGAIPNTTNAPRNAILGPWQDIDPGVTGTISYQLYGTSPNRRLVVSYSNVAMYSSTCNSSKFNGQIKLYETSNNIEIHLKDKPLCTSWNSGQAILGLHNYNGTIAVVPAGGYNAPTQWTATNAGWRFVTSCSTCSVILPIDMLEFTAQYSDHNNNFIKWVTGKEEHVKFFHVERSENGNDFTRISKHNPKAQTGATYTYNDLLPDNNRNYYYRICTEDIDGDISYSGIRLVQRSKDLGPFVIYPNPFNNDLHVAVQTSDITEVVIEIFDALGKKVLHQERTLDTGNNEFTINGVNASPGLLLVKVSDKSGRVLYTHRLIKQ